MSHPEFSTEPFFYEGAGERKQKRPHAQTGAEPAAEEDAWERPLKRVPLDEPPSEPLVIEPLQPIAPAPVTEPTAEPAKARRRGGGLSAVMSRFRISEAPGAFKNAWFLSHAASFLLGFLFCGIIAFLAMPAPNPPATEPALNTALPPLGDLPATVVEADPPREPELETAAAQAASTNQTAQSEPVATPAFTPNTKASALWKPHRIRPGETIRNLSAKYDVEEREIFMHNGGRFIPRVGKTIMLPSRSFKVHTVRRGDSLHVIARKYETDVASLQELNGLKSTSIKVGLPLRIL